MRHARIGFYKFAPGKADEALSKAEKGMFAIYREQPGFVSYHLVKTGPDAGVSISTGESAQQAEAASGLAAGWVRENIAPLVETVWNHTGEVTFSSTPAPARP